MSISILFAWAGVLLEVSFSLQVSLKNPQIRSFFVVIIVLMISRDRKLFYVKKILERTKIEIPQILSNYKIMRLYCTYFKPISDCLEAEVHK